MEERIWDAFAYVARYGHQPLSELKRLPLAELMRFADKLSNIVKAESRREE